MITVLRIRPRGRRAVTMLELLLALSLLVVIASLAWPTVSNSFDNRRLQMAAEQFRSDVVSARVKAMNAGSTFIVRHAPQGDHYIVEPYQNEMLSAVAGEPAAVSVAGEGGDIAGQDLTRVERKLPEGITFVAMEGLLDSREQQIFGSMTQIDERALSMEGAENQMIFCYPDGTTSTAKIALGSTRERGIMLDLRGLTGVVTVSEVMPATELMP